MSDLIRCTKGGMNTNLHAICDGQGRRFGLFIAAGQAIDHIGARRFSAACQRSNGCLAIAVMMLSG